MIAAIAYESLHLTAGFWGKENNWESSETSEIRGLQ